MSMAIRKKTDTGFQGWVERVGIKPTTSSWKNMLIFSELTFYPKMAGTFWCLTWFPPHLQITKLVSPVSPGKEKKANRSHIQAVATDTSEVKAPAATVPGLWVLAQNGQQADTLTSAWPTLFFFPNSESARTFPNQCCITPFHLLCHCQMEN